MELKEIQESFQKLSCENGKIFVDFDTTKKKSNIFKNKIKVHMKNINLNWQFPKSIENLEENLKIIRSFDKEHLKSLYLELNGILSKFLY